MNLLRSNPRQHKRCDCGKCAVCIRRNQREADELARLGKKQKLPELSPAERDYYDIYGLKGSAF